MPRFTHILFNYYTGIYLLCVVIGFGFNVFHITYFSVLVVKIVRNLLFGTILLKIIYFWQLQVTTLTMGEALQSVYFREPVGLFCFLIISNR